MTKTKTKWIKRYMHATHISKTGNAMIHANFSLFFNKSVSFRATLSWHWFLFLRFRLWGRSLFIKDRYRAAGQLGDAAEWYGGDLLALKIVYLYVEEAVKAGSKIIGFCSYFSYDTSSSEQIVLETVFHWMTKQENVERCVRLWKIPWNLLKSVAVL